MLIEDIIEDGIHVLDLARSDLASDDAFQVYVFSFSFYHPRPSSDDSILMLKRPSCVVISSRFLFNHIIILSFFARIFLCKCSSLLLSLLPLPGDGVRCNPVMVPSPDVWAGLVRGRAPGRRNPCQSSL